MRRIRFFSALLLAALTPGAARAALLDTAPPFTISPIFYDVPGRVRAAATDDGFVVVWSARDTAESPAFVSAAKLDSSGSPVGTEFRIASAPPEKTRPSLQSFPDGTFIVAWIQSDGVRAQRFAGDASPLGSELVVFGPTSDFVFQAEVAAARDGSFLVFWDASNEDDGALRAAIFDSNGAPQSASVDPTNGDDRQVSVVSERTLGASGADDGSFVVVWSAGYPYETGAAGGYNVYTRYRGYGRRIEADGSTPDPIFPAGGQYGLNTRHLDDGGFVVVWSDSDRSYDVAPEPLDVFAGVHEADASLRDELQVSRRIARDEDGRATGLAAAGSHGFVVAWSHFGYPAAFPAAAFVRQIDASGAPVGDAVPIPREASGPNGNLSVGPDVAVLGDRALIAWDGGNGIQGQILSFVDEVLCGDAETDGEITASDALAALRSAVGSAYCSLLLCDTDADTSIEASDALRILRASVGQLQPLHCTVHG